ncbi:MAG: toll/interleukin-1 receptor domain-containing protein [Candidatus Tectimicrobiota bacterium]
MAGSNVFLSYSHLNKKYREELCRVLETVPGIDAVLWFDERALTIGDKFHPEILRAMEESRMGVLLLSTDFFRSTYIKQHELPYLLQRAEAGSLTLACLYVTAIPEGAFQRTITVDGQTRTVSVKEYIGVNSPGKPLDALWRKSQRNRVYVELANWMTQQLKEPPPPGPPGPEPPIPLQSSRRSGARFELAVALQYHGGSWHRSFSLPRQPHFTHLAQAEPEPAGLFEAPHLVDGDWLFQLLFGSARHQ